MYKLKISNGVELITNKEDELDFLKTDLFDDWSKIQDINMEKYLWNGELFNDFKYSFNCENYNPQPLTEEILQKFIDKIYRNSLYLDPEIVEMVDDNFWDLI